MEIKFERYIPKTFIIVCLALVGLLASCSNKHRALADRSQVTVTIEPLRFLVERIAGDKMEVRVMVPQGASPETYEPTARQMMQLSESMAYFKVGELGFERSWMKRLEENAPKTTFVNVSEGIHLMHSSDGHPDPHTWMSVSNVRIMAKNIFKALARLDRRDSSYFHDNYKSFLCQLDTLDIQVQRNINGGAGRSFLIYHPLLTYFAHDYGLEQISLEQEGREPSAAQMKQIIAKAKSAKVRVFFMQKEYSKRNVSVVTNSLGVKVCNIDPLGYDWCNNMLHISQNLK